MPVYEYECTSCGRITEAMQKFSDPPLLECECCKGSMRKLISQNTFHLKGSGWYVTDYASKGRATTAKSDTASSTSPAGDKGAGTTESTPKTEKN